MHSFVQHSVTNKINFESDMKFSKCLKFNLVIHLGALCMFQIQVGLTFEVEFIGYIKGSRNKKNSSTNGQAIKRGGAGVYFLLRLLLHDDKSTDL